MNFIIKAEKTHPMNEEKWQYFTTACRILLNNLSLLTIDHLSDEPIYTDDKKIRVGSYDALRRPLVIHNKQNTLEIANHGLDGNMIEFFYGIVMLWNPEILHLDPFTEAEYLNAQFYIKNIFGIDYSPDTMYVFDQNSKIYQKIPAVENPWFIPDKSGPYKSAHIKEEKTFITHPILD